MDGEDSEQRRPQHGTRLFRWRAWAWLWALLLAVAVAAAYYPALHGAFVWDDLNWTDPDTLPALKTPGGLWRMWTTGNTIEQYFPLTGTTFWMDHHFWGAWTLPYHVENVVLHVMAAGLFGMLLTRLAVPGAWFAAAVFALHPVMVESVGWITERKNVLSLPLALGALLAYGRFASLWPGDGRSRGWSYALALLLFLAALLAKISVFMVPPAMLLLVWWKRGRVEWRKDVLPALPFFALTLLLGVATAVLEKQLAGAVGDEAGLTWPQRFLVAGRAPWFYAGKLLWPAHLSFLYPQWTLDVSSPVQWLALGGLVVVLVLGWRLRAPIGRGPLVAVLVFLGGLFPVLGFLNVSGARFTYVADRWVYVPGLALIALAGVAAAWLHQRWRRPWLSCAGALLVLGALAVQTWRHAACLQSPVVLWESTLRENPGGSQAHNLYGVALADAGRMEESLAAYHRAIELKPDSAGAHINLAAALFKLQRIDEAIAEYGSFLAAAGSLSPSLRSVIHYNLAGVLLKKGKAAEAVSHYEQALSISPDFSAAHVDLGHVLVRSGRFTEALDHFLRALDRRPDDAGTASDVATALFQLGRHAEAVRYYERALASDPVNAAAMDNLAFVLATTADASLRDGARAIRIARKACEIAGAGDAAALSRLAYVQDAAGQHAEAAATSRQAADLLQAQGDATTAQNLRAQASLYEAKTP